MSTIRALLKLASVALEPSPRLYKCAPSPTAAHPLLICLPSPLESSAPSSFCRRSPWPPWFLLGSGVPSPSPLLPSCPRASPRPRGLPQPLAPRRKELWPRAPHPAAARPFRSPPRLAHPDLLPPSSRHQQLPHPPATLPTSFSCRRSHQGRRPRVQQPPPAPLFPSKLRFFSYSSAPANPLDGCGRPGCSRRCPRHRLRWPKSPATSPTAPLVGLSSASAGQVVGGRRRGQAGPASFPDPTCHPLPIDSATAMSRKWKRVFVNYVFRI